MFIILPVAAFSQNRAPKPAEYAFAKKSRLGDFSTENKKVLTVEQIKKMLLKEGASLLETVNNFH